MRQTIVWLWGVVRNPDVVWVDVQTKEESHEHWRRIDRFRLFMPTWIRDAFTVRQACGCRRRFGLWRTLYCSDHVNFTFFPEDHE